MPLGSGHHEINRPQCPDDTFQVPSKIATILEGAPRNPDQDLGRRYVFVKNTLWGLAGLVEWVNQHVPPPVSAGEGTYNTGALVEWPKPHELTKTEAFIKANRGVVMAPIVAWRDRAAFYNTVHFLAKQLYK